MADEEDALHMLDEDGIRNALHRHRRLNSFGCSRSLRKLITEANATLQRQGEAARLVTAIQRTPPPGDAPAIASTSSVNAASGQEASKGGCAETFVTPPPPRLRRFDSITPVTISRSEAAHGPALLSTKPSTADAACQHDDTQTCLDSQNPAIPEADSNVLPAPAATTNPAPAEAFTEADYERAALAYAEKRASAPPARRLPTPPPAEPDRATAKGLGAAVQKPARNAPRRRIQTTAAAPLAPAAQPSAARFTAAPPQQGKKSGIATVLYYPVDRMANYLKPTRDAIAAQLSKLPGVKAVRVNFRRNVVAVDAHASADLDPLLGITTICDIKVRAKEAGGNSCTGRVFRVDRALSTEDIMSGIECKVPVLACTRSGNDIILRFAGTHPPEEVSLFKLRRPVRARLPRPLQCLQCGVIGHATAVCTAKPRCLRCGRDHHKSRYLTGGPVECVAVTVRLGGTDTTVASVYVRPGNPWDARLIVRLTQRIKQNLLICGDFNCRHVEWGSRTSSRQGCDVLDAIRAAGLNLLNTGSPTFVRPSCTPTAIDLSVASPDCAYDWSTHPDTAGSDHLPIDILPRTERPADKVTYSVVQWSRFRELCEENPCEPHSFFDHIAACASGATIRCAVLPGTPVPDIKLLNLRAARRRAQRRARRTNKPAHWTIYKRLDAACLRHAKRLRRRSWISVCRALDEPRAQARGWRILSSMLHSKAPRFPALSIAVAKGIDALALADLLAEHFVPTL
ncbi:hypothetical protein V5799_010454, partial [Amblyomma americanum]